jgi:hypothetical protein
MYFGSGETVMLRRGGSGRLRSNQNRIKEDINPMSYVANLVDAMLVLAVGIMLALIISWNLNVSSTGQVTSETTETEDVSKDDAITSFTGDDVAPADDAESVDETQLEEKGTVYYDEGTDTYYIIASDGTTTPLQ